MTKLRLLLPALFFIAAAASLCGARSQDERITVSTTLVTVNVSVTDGGGRRVQGLTQNDFEIFDGGVRQQISHFSAGDAPFSLGII